ncbi:MAG TPA: hypothetical protein VHO06_10460, partial [Polyangia bacterium]|nr:hypothetical protein [Polyangia bacterium]
MTDHARAEPPPAEPARRAEHAPREEIVRRIEAEAVIPIVRAATPDLALRAARAVMAGGLSV